MMSDKNIIDEMLKEYGGTIDNYILDGDSKDNNCNYSVCREERQYAVFLYNILRAYSNPERRQGEVQEKIFNACGLKNNYEIEKVFYEATFMRDIFERNRRIVLGKGQKDKLLNKTFSPHSYELNKVHTDISVSLLNEWSFNHRIKKYCKIDESPNEKEHNLGHGENIELARMMNAKPDIAVIYKVNEGGKTERRLLFVECKFESGESKYGGGESQRWMQGKIAKFLCEEWWKDEIKLAPEMTENVEPEARLVQFVRKEAKEQEKEIYIGDLIKFDKKIFERPFSE